MYFYDIISCLFYCSSVISALPIAPAAPSEASLNATATTSLSPSASPVETTAPSQSSTCAVPEVQKNSSLCNGDTKETAEDRLDNLIKSLSKNKSGGESTEVKNELAALAVKKKELVPSENITGNKL